jgi:hypothetical protein
MPIDPFLPPPYEITAWRAGYDQSAINTRQSEMSLLLIFVDVDILGVDYIVFSGRLAA